MIDTLQDASKPAGGFDRAELLASFFDKKIVAILKEVLRRKDAFGIRDIARASGVSVATTYRILQKLSSSGVVDKVKRGNVSYYALRKSPIFDEVYSLVIGVRPTPIDLFKQKLLGESKDVRFYVSKDASGEKKFFVISSSIKLEKAGKLAAEVKAETGETPKYVVLAPEQFKQMKDMGVIK